MWWSWWRWCIGGVTVILTILNAVVPHARAFAVRQNDLHRECADFQCPETAFESGVRNLIDEESLNTEQCHDCNQCTANGYSVCMRVSKNRAPRAIDNGPTCSCAHSIPINCHLRSDDAKHPSNISLKSFNLCYLSALQAPPRPLAVSEKKSVIFTIEPFWLEPYWRELKLDNLTFHYDFVVKNPEHCEGGIVTSEDDVHFCNNVIYLNTTDEGEEMKDDDYEHSENYDQYDDELPEEVEIDRDIFVGAPEVQVYYIVDVNQPRQLDTKAPFGSMIQDVKTSVESEILKYDLKSDFEPMDNLPLPIDSQEEDEDLSDELGGTEIFADDKPKTSDRIKGEETAKDRLKLGSTNASIDAKDSIDMKTLHRNEGITSEESAVSVTMVSTGSKSTVSKGDRKIEELKSKKKYNDVDENEVYETKDSTKRTKIITDTHTSTEDDDNLSEEDDEDDFMDEQDMSLFERIVKNKGLLSRLVFGTTIAICLLSILCIFIFRRRCFKNMGNVKSLGGHRYDSINARTIPTLPEKEKLNQ